MVWPNDDAFENTLDAPLSTPEEVLAFIFGKEPPLPPAPPVAPIVEITPDPGDGPITPNQSFTVTVLFDQTPTNVVLEYLVADTLPELASAQGKTIYGTGTGFRGGFQASSLVISMSGKLYTFSVVPDTPWGLSGLLKFNCFATDNVGGTT